MSHPVNDNIRETAKEYSEQFTGTTLGKMLDQVILRDDLEGMFELIKEARKQSIQAEFNDEVGDTY